MEGALTDAVAETQRILLGARKDCGALPCSVHYDCSCARARLEQRLARRLLDVLSLTVCHRDGAVSRRERCL